MTVGDGGDPDATMKFGTILAPCPTCRESYRVLDGTYLLNDAHGLDTIFHPPTPAQAKRLEAVTRWAMQELNDGGDQERVRARVDDAITKNAPGWKKVLDHLLSDEAANLATILSLILTVLMFFGFQPSAPAPAPTGLTEDQLRQILEEIHERDTGSGTPLPEPRTPEAPMPAPPTTPEGQ